jgi:hypothetical protein
VKHNGNGHPRSITAMPGPLIGVTSDDRLRLAMEDPERERVFLKWLDDGLAGRGERGQIANAGRLYAEARKLVGTQVELSVKITNLIGATVDRARYSVEAVQRVETMDEHAKARLAVRVLTEYCESHGLAVPSFPARLLSQAEVVDGA